MTRRTSNRGEALLADQDRRFNLRVVRITRPGTAIVAWKSDTAVMSARVISFVKPSPSASVPTPNRSVD
jgi:hypothetical protein